MLLFISIFLFYCSDSKQNDVPQEQQSFETQFPLESYIVGQRFGNQNSRFSNKFHTAEDAEAIAGTAVMAIADGEIAYSGQMGGYGWLIIIHHPEVNKYSLYGHLSTRRDKVLNGPVNKGDVIAYVGDDDEDGSGPGNGYAIWGPHLHFAVRDGNITDYSDDQDDRWMAGYTTSDPIQLNWQHPSNFVNQYLAD